MQAHSKRQLHRRRVVEPVMYAFAVHRIPVAEQTLAALRLNAYRTGTPIILLHDMTQSIYFWIIDQVFRHYGPCYSLSLPGHAPASATIPFTPAMLRPRRLAATLAGAIRYLVGKQPVVVVGHSVGGFAALTLAAYYPELVRGVVTLCGFAQGHLMGTPGWYQHLAHSGPTGQWSLRKLFQFGLRTPAGIHQHLRNAAANPRMIDDYPYLNMLIEHTCTSASQLDLDAMVSYLTALCESDIGELLPAVRAPTLVVAGDSDPVVPPSQATLIANYVPRSTLALLQHTGHLPGIENPASYTRLIHTWMHTRMELQPVYEPLPSFIQL